ncbi:ABC transporter ATP-binding protein [Vallitalea maricola]|uniref:ABC transporter ATP-binding protein n=1 Tax=Vallitalea maricola TaxID=3074433 RepID=A0ACB5UI43_9FIRM|nr:ABC transporter ATP-binding protein [Vallitalea sp. AN17-2]
MSNNILELKKITKVYPNGVVANKDIEFDLKEGEIHAIVGENGAGKSTLMKILFGMEQPSDGEIIFKGSKTTIDNPEKAIEMGIGMVHQHFMLVPSFTVMQNLLLGMEPKKRIFIDKVKAKKITEELSNRYDLHVDPNSKVKNLTVGMKQKVEILKALVRGAKILILDEPTAVLTPQETVELFAQLKKLRTEGHTIIFISHKLKEVKEISDRITIVRKGKSEGIFNTSDVTEKDISRLMVGRDVVLKYDKKTAKYGETVLSVKNLNYSQQNKKILNNINFSLRKGEILGIAGVEGNGQSQLIRLITGNMAMQTENSGEIKIKGDIINDLSILNIRKKGLSYIPEDRMTTGIAGEGNIKENVIGNRVVSGEFEKKFLLNTKNMDELSDNLIEKFLVKCSNRFTKIKSLSGGNIQKVVVARECSIKPEILIAEQPSRGVDVGAIEFIHHQLLDMRDNQTGILLVSADLNEVIELSDNILVMYEGEIVAYFDDTKSITEEELGLCMLGIKKHSEDRIRRAVNG